MIKTSENSRSSIGINSSSQIAGLEVLREDENTKAKQRYASSPLFWLIISALAIIAQLNLFHSLQWSFWVSFGIPLLASIYAGFRSGVSVSLVAALIVGVWTKNPLVAFYVGLFGIVEAATFTFLAKMFDEKTPIEVTPLFQRFENLKDVLLIFGLATTSLAVKLLFQFAILLLDQRLLSAKPFQSLDLNSGLSANPFQSLDLNSILVSSMISFIATMCFLPLLNIGSFIFRNAEEKQYLWLETFFISACLIGLNQYAFTYEITFSNLPITLIILYTLLLGYAKIRFELLGVASIATICFVQFLICHACDDRFAKQVNILAFGLNQYSNILLLILLLIACYIFASILRTRRIQADDSYLLVEALQQKAYKTATLNNKLIRQTKQSRDQAEQLLTHYGELESANRLLVEQQNWLEGVLSNMPVAVFIADKNGRIFERGRTLKLLQEDDREKQSRDGILGSKEFSQTQLDVKKYSASPFDSSTASSLNAVELAKRLNGTTVDGQQLPEEDWPLIRAVEYGERTKDQILRVVDRHGRQHFLSVNAIPIHNHDGDRTGAVSAVIDITERETTRQLIEENNRRFNYALKCAKAIAWERTIDQSAIIRTSELSNWLDYDNDDIFSDINSFFKVIYSEDLDRVMEAYQRYIRECGEFEIEYRMVKKDGSFIWILTRGETIPDEQGKPYKLTGVHFEITAKKEIEQKLRFLESAVVHTRDAVVLLDAKHTPNAGRSVLYVNNAFCKMTGYSQDEVVGRSLNVLRGPESDEFTLAEIRKALDSGDPLQTEILNYRKNDTAYWVELTLQPVRDQWEEIQYWVMIQRDITDRKRSEDALRRSEEMFRGIFENTWAGVSLTDRNGRYISANPAFLAMTGLNEQEIVGKKISELTKNDDWSAQKSDVESLRDGKIDRYQACKKYLKKDGSDFTGQLFCNAIRGPSGEFLYGLGVVVDVTERTKLEQQLRESEARMRAVYENTAAGVVVVNEHSVIVDANPAFANMLGYESSEMIDMTVRQLTWPEDIEKDEQMYRQFLTDNLNEKHFRKRYITKTGQMVIGDVYTRFVRDESSKIKNRISVVINMTDRIALEEQLRHSQKMEAIGQMAGGIAHDFNNLLTAIVGNLSLAKISGRDESLSLLATAEQAAGRAADLTRKLLGYARRSQLQLFAIKPQEVIEEIVQIIRRTLNPLIEIKIDIDPECSMVNADATMLNQVLFNLCLNSRDAMPRGGKLTLACQDVEVESHTTLDRKIRSGRFVRLTVIDTGEGMSEDTKAHIFEPFFTTKGVGKGTGLGLSMVMGIVQQHGGWVEFESEYGVGTRFDIYLPILDLSQKVSPMQSFSTSPDDTPIEIETPKRSGHILLVDDEPMIRSLAKSVLESVGYTVSEAEDGMEAVEWFTQNPTMAELIVMDLTMPRMSGRDAYEKIASIDPKAKVIFSSGYSAEDISDVTGPIGMLAKPYRPADLLNAVQQALELNKLTIKSPM